MRKIRIDIITIFPGMFDGVLGSSIVKRAVDKGLLDIRLHDLRDFSADRHRSVDDRPFGGGAGMVMMPDPIFKAVEKISAEVKGKRPKVVMLSPRGDVFSQKIAVEYSRSRHFILICGHYEGVDERVIKGLVDSQISIGDYVLTGGEIPAMVILDSVARLVPGVLGDPASLNEESFTGNLLEYPQYTRPYDYRGMKVPEVLRSGDHKKISIWRKQQALKLTKSRRPDLLTKQPISPDTKKSSSRMGLKGRKK